MAPASSWLVSGLEDDVRGRMFAASAALQDFALATIVAADGGPRPIGSQMVVTRDDSWGFLSGGCIEDDVANNARAVIASGQPRVLAYGDGSPFIDIRLPCGGRIDVVVEKIPAGDPAVANLRALTAARTPALWVGDGTSRQCVDATDLAGGEPSPLICRRYDPPLRLLVVGSDPFALAIAGLGQTMGWDTSLLCPFGPADPPPFAVPCDRRPLERSLAAQSLDRWTAVAVATHDLELDHEALAHALVGDAGYVGVLGSRRKLGERLAALRASGVPDDALDRLHAPIGLPINAMSPWEVAVAVVAEIIERGRASGARHAGPALPCHVAA